MSDEGVIQTQNVQKEAHLRRWWIFFSPNLFICLPDCDSLRIIVLLQILVTLVFHVYKLKKKSVKEMLIVTAPQ